MGAPLHGPGPPGGRDRANIPEDRLERKKKSGRAGRQHQRLQHLRGATVFTNPTTPEFAGTAWAAAARRAAQLTGRPGRRRTGPPTPGRHSRAPSVWPRFLPGRYAVAQLVLISRQVERRIVHCWRSSSCARATTSMGLGPTETDLQCNTRLGGLRIDSGHRLVEGTAPPAPEIPALEQHLGGVHERGAAAAA